MWDLLVGPMPATMPLCGCCAAKAGLESDICRMSLMIFCLSMGLGNETGRSSQKSCGWAFCRSFRMSSSSDDCRERRKMSKQRTGFRKQLPLRMRTTQMHRIYICTYRCNQRNPNLLLQHLHEQSVNDNIGMALFIIQQEPENKLGHFTSNLGQLDFKWAYHICTIHLPSGVFKPITASAVQFYSTNLNNTLSIWTLLFAWYS